MTRRRTSLAAAATMALLAAASTSAQRTGGVPAVVAPAPPPPPPAVPSPKAPAAPAASSTALSYVPNTSALSGTATGPVYKKSDTLEPVSVLFFLRSARPPPLPTRSIQHHHTLMRARPHPLPSPPPSPPNSCQFYANVYGIPIPAGSNDPDVLVTVEVSWRVAREVVGLVSVGIGERRG